MADLRARGFDRILPLRRNRLRLFVYLLLAIALIPQLHSEADAAGTIVINEVMYNPVATDPTLEFVEIHNPQAPRFDLSGWRLEGEIDAVFPPGTWIRPGEYIVFARDPERLQAAYGLKKRPLPFEGKLDNGGGTIRLVDRSDHEMFTVRIDDKVDHFRPTDGAGHSVCLLDPYSDPSLDTSWRASPRLRGTPGANNGFGSIPGEKRLPKRAAICINEVRAGDETFIELYNRTAKSVDITGWHLSDAPHDPTRFQFPADSSIPAHGVLHLPMSAFEKDFRLDPEGFHVALFDRKARRVWDAVRGKGTSPIGRAPDGGATLRTLATASPGKKNGAPPRSSVVISEILYSPQSRLDAEEFLELHNRGSAPVALDGFRLKGAVRFPFASGTQLDAGAYLVVAKDPARLRSIHSLTEKQVVGPYKGTLSNGGETIRLVDAAGELVDAVAYGDGRPWPEWADGQGASLELVDVDAPNDLPAAWTASESPAESEWETFRYFGSHEGFAGANHSEFQFMLLGPGECLIDDVKLVTMSGKVISSDGSLGGGGVGWDGMGTHQTSGVVEFDDNGKTRKVFKIRATGRGGPRYNFVTVKVRGQLKPGKKYGLQFKAKWLRGSSELLTRTFGHGVAHCHRLKVPERLGTPGKKNSRTRPGPIVGIPEQTPVAPSVDDPVRLRVRVDGAKPTSKVTIRYRADGQESWKQAAGVRDSGVYETGTEFWNATIPAMPAGIVEYVVEAESAGGERGSYPLDPERAAPLYLVGLETHESLPSYSILMTQKNRDHLRTLAQDPNITLHDNTLIPVSLVYGDSRIIHDVAIRWRGSPYSRPSSFNWRLRFGEDTLDGRRSVNLDGQTQDAQTLQHEKLVHWLLTRIDAPSVRHRYVWVDFFGRESQIFEHTEKIDGDFLARWFPGKGRGHLHKVNQHFEFVEGRMVQTMARLEYRGKNPEEYRWHFEPRATGGQEDFGPLIQLAALMDPKTTNKTRFLKEVEKVVDIDQWLRTLAVRTYVCDWDTFGIQHGKNSFLYRSPGEEGRWNLIAWDSDLTFGGMMGRPNYPIYRPDFPSVARLLSIPGYRRQFEGYLAFLAEGPCDPDALKPILQETGEACGKENNSMLRFVRARNKFVLEQLAKSAPFTAKGKRVKQKDGPDLLRLTGVGPIRLNQISVNDTPYAIRFLDDKRWRAEIPVGPEKADVKVQGQDMSGAAVGETVVKLRARKKALPLPDKKSKKEDETAEPPRTLPKPKATVVLDLGKGRTPPPGPAEKPVDATD